MNWFVVAILALPFAVWRLSSIFVSESGPFNIMDKVRYRVGIRYNEYNQVYGTNTFADLFTCVWCMSVWVSALLVIIMIIDSFVGAMINIALAGSCIAIIIDTILEKENG